MGNGEQRNMPLRSLNPESILAWVRELEHQRRLQTPLYRHRRPMEQ